MAAVGYLVANPEVPHGPVKVAFNPDEEIGRGVIHFPVESFGAVAAYTVDGSTAGEVQTETFSGAQVRMRIHGRAIHPGWAKGELVNAIKIAGRDRRAPAAGQRSRPRRREGREGYVHPVLVEGDSSEVELRFIVRDFDDDRLAEHIAFLPRLADEVCATEPRCTVEVERPHPVPQPARRARAASRDRRATSRRRSAASASSRSRRRSAAAPTARR